MGELIWRNLGSHNDSPAASTGLDYNQALTQPQRREDWFESDAQGSKGHNDSESSCAKL